MKKISTLLLLSFVSFSSFLSFADERHDAIIDKYKETHPQGQDFFYTLDEVINTNENLNNAHLVITGQELKDQNFFINELHQDSSNIHIILDVEEGDGLVNKGSLSLDSSLAEQITRLTIVNIAQDITSVKDNFLRNCGKLIQLDIYHLCQVTKIGDFFLGNCSGLAQLDLSSLNQVIQIGDGFLYNCSGLTHLDLSPLCQVIQIGRGFLNCCSELICLDLSSLGQVTQIGDLFLGGCSNLIQLDLSPLGQVTQIDCAFLGGCSKLIQLDLSPLGRVTQIGPRFLENCSGLTQLDLSSLNQVIQIGNDFLSGCEGLITFNQIDLSAYNVHFKNALEDTFPEDTILGDEIRQNYIEGYIPPRKNIKSARR